MHPCTLSSILLSLPVVIFLMLVVELLRFRRQRLYHNVWQGKPAKVDRAKGVRLGLTTLPSTEWLRHTMTVRYVKCGLHATNLFVISNGLVRNVSRT